MISYLANRDTEPVSAWRDAGVGLAWFTVGVLLVGVLPEIAVVWGTGPDRIPGRGRCSPSPWPAPPRRCAGCTP